MSKKALIVGGNSGIGLSVLTSMLDDYDHIYVVGKDCVDFSKIDGTTENKIADKCTFYKVNFICDDFSVFDKIKDINTLVISVGFGRVASFADLSEAEVDNLIKVNLFTVAKIIKKYYSMIESNNSFYTAVLGSIAGLIASPLFSVYGAAKSAVCKLIENLNAELKAKGYDNRILNVSPGVVSGTSFYGQKTDLSMLDGLACEIKERMLNRETLYIPKYEDVYCNVIASYNSNPERFAIESYEYKVKSGRVSNKPQVVVGYLSGTFDLFHVGHLNLLKRAKAECDYLIVGVHRSGSWKGKETYIPFEERCQILEANKYVDRVVESPVEDSDAWELYRYDKLFVGSDYEGSDRFKRYEAILEGKAQIIYFPYTQGTSSTQLRDAIGKKK